MAGIAKINGAKILDKVVSGSFMIFAEESGNLSTAGNGQQFSYGNGAVGSIGIPIPFACDAKALVFQAETFGTSCTISLYKGFPTTNPPSSTGESISIVGTQHSAYTAITPVSFNAGEYAVFRTTAVVGTYGNVRVGVQFDYPIELNP